MNTDLQRRLEKLSLLEQRKRLKYCLPHLEDNGYKFYNWMHEFYHSEIKMNLVCSANQIGKSSINIRKCIDWATNVGLWKKLWPHISHPRQFWYLYPSSYVATIEVEKKWIPEFLPREEFAKDPVYGYRLDYRSRYIQAIHFNSGISVYFKTYSQDPQDLQTGTCAAMFTDEELPEELYPELQMRLAATDGYFNAVFTPTLGQEFWREAIEIRGFKERFPDALKLQVSMFDCMYYRDGTKSFWTQERIQRIINACKSEAEVQRRVYGKFVLDSGLKYPGYSSKNLIEPRSIPPDWSIYIGVDSGSGGRFNHPAAYTCLAMRPDNRLGYFFRGKRFDGITTTASDIVQAVGMAVADMRASGIKNPIVGTFYDFAATDLREISSRMGEAWTPAEKSHAIGEQILNVAFKNDMLFIFNIEELAPLVSEIKTLKISTPKNQAKDDALDSARYSATKVGWDWGMIGEKPILDARQQSAEDLRRGFVMETGGKEYETVEEELEAFDELIYGAYGEENPFV